MSLLPTHWYYNTETGQLTQGNNLENLGNNLVGGAGWHELNIAGNATEAQAAAEAKREFPNGAAPTNAGITPQRVASTAAQEAGVSNPLDFLGEIGDFFTRLTQGNTWIRIAKVLVGGVLVLVGLSHISGADNAVANTARKVPVIV